MKRTREANGEHKKPSAATMINEADDMPPAEKETESSIPHMPMEIIEKVLINVPLKSLASFTSVSTPWKSTIQSLLSAAERRKILVINDNPSQFDVWSAFTVPLSTVSNHPLLKTTSDLVRPFQAEAKLKAFCDELCCVLDEKSLYLWNPSTGTYKEVENVPRDPRRARPHVKVVEVVYGLGYDAVDDDYKLLRTWRYSGEEGRSSLYSLKSDSWIEIQGLLRRDLFPDCNGLSVNGALHWMAISKNYANWHMLVSFDFSAKEFRVLQQPVYDPKLENRDIVDVAVLRGKLCVFLNYRRSYWNSAFVLWAMEEYGVVESWRKLYEITCDGIPPTASELFRRGSLSTCTLRPLYVYEDGRVVIWACRSYKESSIIVYSYKDRKVVGQSKILPHSGTMPINPKPASSTSRVRGGFVYIESLVSFKEVGPR